MTDAAVTTVTATSSVEPDARDRSSFRVASALSLAAGVLVGVSSVLPWVSTEAHHRSAFRFGPGYFGPALLGCAAALVLSGVVMLVERPRPNVCMPFVPALIALLLMASEWAGPLYYHPGAGVLVCLLGVASGVGAGVVLLPTEHPIRR